MQVTLTHRHLEIPSEGLYTVPTSSNPTSHRSGGSYMSSIQPDLGSFLYIWCGNPGLVGTVFLYCLASSHLNLEVLVNLLHRGLDLISIPASMILLLRWFCCKWHLWVHSLDRKERSALSCLQYSIICSKLRQRKPLYPVILLVVDKHLQALFHTGIHSFSLAIHLRMERCWHSSVNP